MVAKKGKPQDMASPIPVRMVNRIRDRVQHHADGRGRSVNKYIVDAVIRQLVLDDQFELQNPYESNPYSD